MAQVSFAEDDDMIKTFPSDRTNQSFRMSILPWRSRCGWPVTNPHRVKTPFKYLAVNAVAIADDIPRHRFPATGLRQLPSNPISRRISSRLNDAQFAINRNASGIHLNGICHTCYLRFKEHSSEELK